MKKNLSLFFDIIKRKPIIYYSLQNFQYNNEIYMISVFLTLTLKRQKFSDSSFRLRF
jgi:hypothetical protein